MEIPAKEETSMKTAKAFGRVIGLPMVSAILAVVLFYCFAGTRPVAQAHAQDQNATTGCTLATISGSYGTVSFSGASSGGFAGEVGILTPNGKGSATWTLTVNNESEVENHTETGTYTLGSNCSGTMTLQLSGQTYTFDIVVVSNGNQIDILNLELGEEATHVANKIS
jgi:hypothetical protein